LEKKDPARKAARKSRTARTKKIPTKSHTDSEEKRSRYTPAVVEEAAFAESGGQCTFVSSNGRRCTERLFLERDHKVPFGKGGRSDDPANMRHLCRTHNRLMAERAYGKEFIA